MSQQLANRIALITGASRGIGAAVARRFAEEGAHVILVARTGTALEEMDDAIRAIGGQATLVALDLEELPKIDELADIVAQRFGRLDILVGNAATLGSLTPLAHAEPTMWDQVMAVNLTANWRLIRAFDPLLRASDAGRVIFVTSGVVKTAPAYWGAYSISKAALEMLARIYAAEVMKTTQIRVNLLDPGVVRTRMRAEAFPGENPLTLPEPDSVTDAFVRLALPLCRENGELVQAA